VPGTDILDVHRHVVHVLDDDAADLPNVRTCAVIRVRNSWWLRLRRPGESMTLVWFTAFTMSATDVLARSIPRRIDDDVKSGRCRPG